MPSNPYAVSAKYYGFAFAGDQAAMQQRSLIDFHIAGGSRVLEVGAGTGDLAFALAEGGHTVVALEQEDSLFSVMLDRFKGRPELALNMTPLPTLAVGTNPVFDCVVASNVLSQVDSPQRDQLLDLAVGCLVSDGRLILNASQPTPLRRSQEWEEIGTRALGEAQLRIEARSLEDPSGDSYMVEYRYSIFWQEHVVAEDISTHVLHLIELESLRDQLMRRGLRIERAYSSWLGDDYVSTAGGYVIVARNSREDP